MRIEIIFPAWHTDRRAFLKLNYKKGNAIITGAIHVDPKNKQEEIRNITIFLQTISRMYQNEYICIYADLNIQPGDKILERMIEESRLFNLIVVIPKHATRRGYGSK